MGLRKLDDQGLWSVDGNPIYIPDTDVTILYSHLAGEDSGRDESGYMHINWLRRHIAKVGLKYSMMTGSEFSYMCDLMQGKEFTFTYADKDDVHTIQAYTGDVTGTLFTRLNGIDLYKDVSINVIEL